MWQLETAYIRDTRLRAEASILRFHDIDYHYLNLNAHLLGINEGMKIRCYGLRLTLSAFSDSLFRALPKRTVSIAPPQESTKDGEAYRCHCCGVSIGASE